MASYGQHDKFAPPLVFANKVLLEPSHRHSFTRALWLLSGFHSRAEQWDRSCMYEFPIAVVAHYHKLSGLKQLTFILLQFWKSEI